MTSEGLGWLEVRLAGRLGAFELDAELKIPAAGVTALVGPSGCGKTTLLRCLSGFCRVSGRIAFKGDVWQDGARFVPPYRRMVGYVFQEASLFPHLSVRQNLAYSLRRVRGPVGLGLDAAVELLGLARLLDRDTHRLSGGERQRVAIARALLTQPQLLLMDEPVSSLDLEGKAEVLAQLEGVLGGLSIPVIYVSHDPGEVRRLANLVLPMRAGRISAAPPPPAADAAELAALESLSPAEVRRLALAALKAGLRPD